MTKFDPKAAAANSSKVFETIEAGMKTGRKQPEASPEEKKERLKALKTQGRKGCKAPRINLAFTEPNYEFIALMSKATGRTMTRFINDIIDKFREENGDIEADAKKLIEKIELK